MCNVIPVYLIAQLLSQVCSERCEFFRCMFSCYVLALSAKVAFAPFSANVIAVLDVATNRVETVELPGSITEDGKFRGAAAVGSKVVFAPANANVIAVLDVATNKVETVDLGSVTGSYKFSGAAAAFTF